MAAIGPVNIEARIATDALPGSPDILAEEVRTIVGGLLTRRGFSIVPSEQAKLRVSIELSSTRRDRLVTGIQAISSISYNSAIGAWQQPGPGVAMAMILGSLSSVEVQKQMIGNVRSVEGYTHSLAIEIRDADQGLLWVGESTWDAPSPEFRGQVVPAVQMLFSSLPHDEHSIPAVRAIRQDKGENFYEVMCAERWLACPALPYRIAFSSQYWSWEQMGTRGADYRSSRPSEIEDDYAMAAFVDLLETAEYALPLGSGDYKEPLREELWRKVQLGGVYDVGDRAGTKVLVDLVGKPWGYLVDRCVVASDEEWGRYEQRMALWQAALHDYFDFWEE